MPPPTADCPAPGGPAASRTGSAHLRKTGRLPRDVRQTGNRQLPKTIITTGYAEVSYDGKQFERVVELEKGCATIRPDRPVKAVRIISTCDDNGTPYVTIQPPQVLPRL